MNEARILKVLLAAWPDGLSRATYPRVAELIALLANEETAKPPPPKLTATPPRPAPAPRSVGHEPRPKRRSKKWKPYPKLREQIKRALLDAGRPLTASEVVRASQMHPATVYRALPMIAKCVGSKPHDGGHPGAASKLWQWDEDAKAEVA